jgi:putative methionine-R-sulfoxide reductase with GAF domain
MDTAIARLERHLDEERVRLGAASCTFYVADPYWQTEYRLVCMPGVKFREPMYGFMTLDRSTHDLICDGPPEKFVTATVPENQATNRLPPKIPEGIRSLFLGFSEREGVQSYARLKSVDSNGFVEAILFVNFEERTTFADAFKEQIREVLKAVRQKIPAIAKELLQADARPLAEAVKILQPAQAFARRWVPPVDEGVLAEQLELILKRSLNALEINPDQGFGTIHLYEPGAGILRLAAHYGEISLIEKARVQGVFKGVGVISWVVLRQRALLIKDISTSEFRRIQVVIDSEVNSELAVPMIANGELIGVLNLECRKKNAFSTASVRSIWYAAESAAAVYQSWRNSRTSWALMDITTGAIKGGQQTRVSLDKLATVFRDSLGADLCDIWHFNIERQCLYAVGASYSPFEPAIRPDGWSSFVWKSKNVIWINGIQAGSGFAAMRWNSGVWEDITDPEAPTSINEKSKSEGIHEELAVPILVAGNCVAVAWLKYRRSRVPPGGELIDEAVFWANQAAIVVEAVQRQLEIPEKKQLDRIARTLSEYWNTGPLDFGSDVPIEGFAVHRPFHAPACGDFHAISLISTESTVGLLVGDGESHAVSGLLNALPLIASFNAFGKDSGSTRYLMDKLMTISNKLGLAGTAIYCTFTLVQDRHRSQTYLSATSAGHPRLILLRAETWNAEMFPKNRFARGKSLGFRLPKIPEIKLPLGEEQTPLNRGDIVIAYTDGISDSFVEPSDDRKVSLDTGEERMSLSETRIIDAARRCCALGSCEDIANSIVQAAEIASGATGLSDDATVCIVRVMQNAQTTR